MRLFRAQDLVGLVAFAAQDDHVVGAGLSHGTGDGLPAVFHHQIGLAQLLDALENVGNDFIRRFGPGIVRGDDGKIRQLDADLAHDGPLDGIPVAAAAEDGNEPPLAEAANGAQDVFQRIGGVGVVDQNGVVLPGGGHHLQPSLHPCGAGKGLRGSLRANAQADGHTQHGEGVIDGEAAGDPHADRPGMSLVAAGKGNVIRAQHNVVCGEVRLAALGRKGQTPAGGLVDGLCHHFIVDVEDAEAGPVEEQRLGLPVGLHGLVEIQVILGQIGKGRHRKGNAVHPVQEQGVGGNLHHHMGASGLGHLREQPLELKALRGGALRGDHLIADHVLDRADQTHLRAQSLLQHGFQQVGHRGLAVGAGDAQNGHFLRRVAEPIRSQHSQRDPGIRDADVGDIDLRLPLAEHAGRAPLHGHGDEPVSVSSVADDGHK